VPFRIHYRNNLIDKKDSYPIPRPPSWDDRTAITVISFTPVMVKTYIISIRVMGCLIPLSTIPIISLFLCGVI
jgi:hypothetical protein